MGETKKIVIAVVVYDRIGNFIKWCKLAKLLKSQLPDNLEVRIIHNFDKIETSNRWKKISENYPVTFIQRQDKGLDIGAFQEVCSSSLKEFKNDFDFLIWFTDDCFPTDLNFLNEFLNPFENEKVGMTCFEVSKHVRPHARTTGFCLRKDMLSKITFPVPVITTKQNCYAFEHGENNLYLQIKKLDFEVVQIERPIFYNPDSPKVKAQGLEKSLENLYKLLYDCEEPIAFVFATAYNRYPQIISSVFCQFYFNTFLEIWYDGKANDVFKTFFKNYQSLSPSFKFLEIGETPQGNYGHHLKKQFLEKLDDSESEYLLITNEDNYISPYFIQKAVEVLEKFPDKVGAYCTGMIHNYKSDTPIRPVSWRKKKSQTVDGHIIDGYGLIPCKMERDYIDIGAVVLRTSVAKSISWGDFSHSSDWDYLENIANSFGGKDKFIAFPGIHFVHN